MKKRPTKKPKVHNIGDSHFVSGVRCTVKFINAGTAWLCPTFDDPEYFGIARHIAYARIERDGKVTIL